MREENINKTRCKTDKPACYAIAASQSRLCRSPKKCSGYLCVTDKLWPVWYVNSKSFFVTLGKTELCLDCVFGFFFLFDNGKLIKLYDENSLLFMSYSLLKGRTSSCGLIHVLLSGCFSEL